MSKISINISADVFNPTYIPELFCEKRFLHLWGGTGSGKSRFAAQKIVFRMIYETGHTFLLLRKVKRTIRNSSFAEIRKVITSWGVEDYFTIHPGNLRITCVLNGNLILCEGLDNPEKLKSITGEHGNITGAWIEEATELEFADLREITRRIRGYTDTYKQIIFSYNPIDERHWLNTEIHKGGKYRDQTRLLKTTYKDNQFLTAEDIQGIEDLRYINEEDFEIYGLGKWLTPSHLILPVYYTDPFPYHLDSFFGIDFGINVPTALIRCAFDGDSDVYLHEEFYESNTEGNEFIALLKGIIPREKRFSPIYPDPEDANRVLELKRAGFNVMPVSKAVKSGLEYMRRFRIHITPESTNLAAELGRYKWKLGRDKLPLDEPIKLHDHAIDATRYAIYTHGPKVLRSRSDNNAGYVKPVTARKRGGGLEGFGDDTPRGKRGGRDFMKGFEL